MGAARRSATPLALSCLLFVGCSSDDDDPSADATAAPPTVAVASSGVSESTALATPAATDPRITVGSAPDSVGEGPPTTPTTALTAESTAASITESTTAPTAAPATEPTTGPTSGRPDATTSGTDDPRTAAGARLAALLPTAEALGVPGDWAVRDLQSGADEGSIPPSELDAFRGVATCPEELVALDEGGPWAERKLNGVDPDPDGVLIIRLQLIEETAAEWSSRQQALAKCTPASVDAFFENGPGSITLPGFAAEEVEAQRIAVFSSATEAAPFPSQVVSMSANADGRTANVTLFGLNEADPFDDDARALLTELLTAR